MEPEVRDPTIGLDVGKPLHKKTLEIVKEWGGVATVLIAILYTFPFDIVTKYINWKEQTVADTRKVLSDVAVLSADRVLNLEKITDWQTKDFLGGTYNSRIYNLMITHKDTFRKAAPRLGYSELFTIGSQFVLAGLIAEALPFFELAIEKAQLENPLGLVPIYREKGYSLFIPSPVQDLQKARIAYQQALELALRNAMPNEQTGVHLRHLSELAIFELRYGDWECGQAIRVHFGNAIKPMLTIDRSASEFYQMFAKTITEISRRSDQAADGCNYRIPLRTMPQASTPVPNVPSQVPLLR